MSQRPLIQIDNRRLRDIAEDAIKALEVANEPPFVFKQGCTLVRVGDDPAQGAQLLNAHAVKGVLDRVADFVTLGGVGAQNAGDRAKAARPPSDLAPDLLARADLLPLPELRGIVSSPVFIQSGELISKGGYHSGSGIMLRLERLEHVRSDMPLEDAVKILRDNLLADFPFAHPQAGFAHTLAATLQPFVRPMIDGPTPLFLVEAPTRGTGKGLLADVISLVTTGSRAQVMVQTNDSEFDKRITSLLSGSSAVILLDNVHRLSGVTLAAALTATVWRGRRLGQSRMLTLPNTALWLATGNNVKLDDDMPRRIVPIRLDPEMERPEYRTGFKHPRLLEWVKANRTELVSACLSIVQGCLRACTRWAAMNRGDMCWAAFLNTRVFPDFLRAANICITQRTPNRTSGPACWSNFSRFTGPAALEHLTRFQLCVPVVSSGTCGLIVETWPPSSTLVGQCQTSAIGCLAN
jgi:hypothetical protein